MNKYIWILGTLIVTSLLSFLPSCSTAPEKFPSKPMTIVVGWNAGGDSDAYARLLASELQVRIGVPVNVVNVAGASTTLAMTQVMNNLQPDGYTMFQLEAGTIAPHALGQDVPDARSPKEVKNLGSLQFSGAALVTLWKNSKYQSIQDVINDINARPGQVKIGIAGATSGSGIATWIFKAESKLPFEVVPLAGGSDILKAVLSGDLDLVVQTYGQWPPYLGENVSPDQRVRLLLFLDEERLSVQPDIPTSVELGLSATPPYFMVIAMAVSPKTDEKRAQFLEDVFSQLYTDPAFLAKVEALRGAGEFRTSEETYALISGYWDKVKKLVDEGVLK